MPGVFARISTLLGVADLSDTTEADLQRLIDGAVREDSDLDFKQTTYGNGDSEKRALAGDVAALANTVGGVIVIGVRDDDGLAVELVPVALSEDEELRMRQAVASYVAPVVQPAAIHRVPSEIEGMGYYLVAVHRSNDRPHAVRVNDALRYSVRNGPSTRHLSESEVADLYRSRFRTAAQQVARLPEMERDVLQRLDMTDLPWLVVSLVPNNSGSMALRWNTPTQLGEWARKATAFPTSVLRQNTIPQAFAGVGRVVLSQAYDYDTNLSRYGHLELHTDGAGLLALPIWSARGHDRAEGKPYLAVRDELLVGEMIGALDVLAAHAVDNTFVVGDGVIRASILRPTNPDESKPLVLTHARGFFRDEEIHPGRARHEIPPSEHTVDISSVRASARDTLIAARLILTDLFNGFGIPELLQITDDGRLRRRYFHRETGQAIGHWAEARQVEMTDETIT